MKVKLIFIDDEVDILNIVRLKMRKINKLENVEIILLESAREFHEFIKEDDSDVVSIISDINMPDNDVLDRLQEHSSKYRFVLSYLCSAYDSSGFEEMMERYNIEFFFKKPLNIDDLKKKLLQDLVERGIRIQD